VNLGEPIAGEPSPPEGFSSRRTVGLLSLAVFGTTMGQTSRKRRCECL
jgi:hypothetical protein